MSVVTKNNNKKNSWIKIIRNKIIKRNLKQEIGKYYKVENFKEF